ncbi:hypothetical protein C2G38_2073297 [Gigaspora rosea]|uniref:Uncharacterized protein n=1 Tax=Gigaspora rosea TaxID=44941 RepID=A0A397VL99_9GLOM|nr:hypothetical protein C2G38_2073297 [Gigaspora rosea]
MLQFYIIFFICNFLWKIFVWVIVFKKEISVKRKGLLFCIMINLPYFFPGGFFFERKYYPFSRPEGDCTSNIHCKIQIKCF